MRNIQAPRRRVMQWLVAAFALAILTGCPNPLRTPDAPDSQTGTLSLTITRQAPGRTIMPPPIGPEEFEAFRLVFTFRDNPEFEPVKVDWTEPTGEVTLAVGRWDLVIYAFLETPYPNEEPTNAVAMGLLEDIAVPTAGSVNVPLAPITEGEGTFAWNLGFENVTGAYMAIWLYDDYLFVEDATPYRSFTFFGAYADDREGDIPLGAGRYHVVLRAYDDSSPAEMIAIHRTLHVYRGMTSLFERNITSNDFPGSILGMILDRWDGQGWNLAGISHAHFEVLASGEFILGVNAGNYAEVFDFLTDPQVTGVTPTNLNLYGFRILIDAALVDIGMAGTDFLYAGNHDTRAEAEATAAAFAVNHTQVTSEWIFGDTLRARVGVYAPSEAEFTDSILMVVPGDSLVGRLGWVHTYALTRGLYLVEAGNTLLAPEFLSFYPDRSDVTVVLRGDGQMRTVSLSENGSLFEVGYGVTLVLDDNITLQGRSDNTHPLVWVDHGGSLIMNAGARIVGNTNANPDGWPRGAGVKVHVGGAFTMNGGEISDNHVIESWPGGGGVVVSGHDGIETRFVMHGGTITDNTSEGQGGGVAIYHGTFDMYGGTIYYNTAYSGGGGVFVVDNGTFAMQGGTISDNISEENGGAVNVNNDGTFTMHGGDIMDNTAQSGGGVHVSSDGTFGMYGGTISDNHSTGWPGGGGVYVGRDGTFDMNGGTISGNTATRDAGGWSYGGGVIVRGEGAMFTMNVGATISDNTAMDTSGGAVGVREYGTFAMYGGDILRNTASTGGGVSVTQDGTFAMNGGTISRNTATGPGGGGGVTVSGATASVTMNVGAIIYDNTSAGGGGGGVSVVSSGTFTMNGGTISDNGNTGWRGGGGVVVHGGGSGFTMYDGAISGNTSVQVAGGVSIMDGGTFDIHDGTISGNTATPFPGGGWSSGGGVRVYSGTFTMYGGEISDNTAVTIPGGWTSGGGLMFVNTSTFTMHDGTISDNAASAGAGVFVDGSSAFTMHNGEIFGNTALIHAGGVRVDSGGVFQISNGVIHGSDANQSLRNTAPSGAALWGMAEYGTFPAGVFSRTGDLITTNNTVEVANGVALQGGIPQGGQVIDLTPAAANYLGVVTATGVPFALLITDAGEFVELHIDSYNEVHGLDLMFGPHSGFPPGIVDLHTAGLVTFGGTYTITMEGRAAWLPEGYVRIAPWPAGSPGQPDAEDQGSRVALSTGELEFDLEFEFTPQAGNDYGRVRILISDAATTLILTSVEIRNADGVVVWSLAEALMSPL